MDDLPYEVYKKIIKSGNILEIFEYGKSYWVGWPKFRRIHPRTPKSRLDSEQDKIRADNVKRARQKITRLINCNPELKAFITLTFNKEVLDLKTSNICFDRFIKRMNYLIKDFKYLAIPEFQPISKRVHYHLISNYPLPKFKNTEERHAYEQWFAKTYWKNGYVNVNSVKNIKYVGIYISKYLGKELFDPRYFKKRKFIYSRTLRQPEIINRPEEVSNFLDYFNPDLLELVKEREFQSDRLGLIKTSIYRINEMTEDELTNFVSLDSQEKDVDKKKDIDEIVFL